MNSLYTFLSVMSALVVSCATATYYMFKNPAPAGGQKPIEPAQSPELAPVATSSPQTAPVSNLASPAPVVDKIRVCAAAQQAFEGWYPGSDSYRHNDPGNCRNLDGQDITFATYEAGFAYLEDYIRRVATGKHPAYPKGGSTTIYEYTHVYTGDAEPAPTNYAAAIARALAVPTSTPMSYLLA